jgi:diaminohydroxyphosphoribosylaminopyrimidine deaminase/5-amino-6-(5-phosphoribosylamino)uracil reductase
VLRYACDGGGRIDVKEAVRQLSGAGLSRLLVEGGAQVFTSFVREGVWDAMFLFHSPKAFGERGVGVYTDANPMTPDAVSVDAFRLDDDFLIRYLNRRVFDHISAALGEA